MSYSLYLFHFGVVNTLYALLHTENTLHGPVAVAVYFVASALLTVASYRLVEQPMKRLRKRFGSHVEAGASGQAVAPEGIALVGEAP
jgi:peptidoglycan/LPS O-acetylase OafA/YrhL